MQDAFADIRPVLIICQRAGGVTHGMEVVSLHVRAVHGFIELVQFLWLSQRHQCQQVVEMVKHNHLLIKNIEHVGCIVFGLCLVLDRNVFEIAYRIE